MASNSRQSSRRKSLADLPHHTPIIPINRRGSSSSTASLIWRRGSDAGLVQVSEAPLQVLSLVFPDQIEQEFKIYAEKCVQTSNHWTAFLSVYTGVGCLFYSMIFVIRNVSGKLFSWSDFALLLVWTFSLIFLMLAMRYKLFISNSIVAVGLNWVACIVGLLGHYFLVDFKVSASEPLVMFVPAIVSFHLFNYIPFVQSLVSMVVLGLGYLILGIVNQFYLYESFLYCLLSVFIIIMFSVFICYQQEKVTREQFWMSRTLTFANQKLVNQLRSLQQSYGRKAADFDSPLEKVSMLTRSLLADPSLAGHQIEVLTQISCLLNSANLFTPDFDSQVKIGQIEMDDQQQKWLFSEVAKRNSAMPVRKRSLPAQMEPQPLHEILLSIHEQIVKNELKEMNEGRKGSHGSIQVELTESIQSDNFVSKVSSLLERIDEWNFPIFQFSLLTDKQPLFVMSLFLARKHNLFDSLRVDERCFIRCVQRIESGYRKDIPYHTNTHAADVLHSSYYFCQHTKIGSFINDTDLFAVIFSAIIHDFEHPGLNNNFLINTLDDKALLYNDSSVLENHHLAASFKVMLQAENNFTFNWSTKEFKDFRKFVLELVKATDLSRHFELLGQFKTRISSSEKPFAPESDRQDNILLYQILLKAADVSNSSKTLNLHIQWVTLVLEEFFAQGDRERQLGLAISPLMDRQTVNLASSQSGFIDFICLPLFESFDLFAGIGDVLEDLLRNREHWKVEEDKKKEDENKTLRRRVE